MATRKRQRQGDPTAAAVDLLGDLLIVELAKAGVPQPQIRKILGCDMHRVSRIARHFKKVKREKD
jgi:hypothetical protein